MLDEVNGAFRRELTQKYLIAEEVRGPVLHHLASSSSISPISLPHSHFLPETNPSDIAWEAQISLWSSQVHLEDATNWLYHIEAEAVHDLEC